MYQCLTCKLVDTDSICKVCASNCHKTHEVTKSNTNNFFCGCGARDDGCVAQFKRTSQYANLGPALLLFLTRPS